ncbi:hypothetical protein AB0P36_33360 [Streptomyces flavidovirens]|uniref:hypothetical protein n=1 Tax=Streptomyces flavidovirens TaxID=67298 RepID=UPI00343EEF85
MSSESPTPNEQPARGPTCPEEALELVKSRFGRPTLPDGTLVPLQVEEFDLGYVVYAVYPKPAAVAGVPQQPAEPGGSSLVVAKDNGEIATVPNYPPELAIKVFKKHYRSGS